MKNSGFADAPLHGGRVPRWLASRMAKMGRAITEAIVVEYGRDEFLKKLSDPLWFQSFGAVMGMDWHSSGITTSVMGALKKGLNPIADDLGLYICGGRGKHSRHTPNELVEIAFKTGLDGDDLVRTSKLIAKVDSTAVQDGFQVYLHSFLLTKEGKWAVVQQGMNQESGMARRYHWHSGNLKSFVQDPHSSVTGRNQGEILNLVHKGATGAQDGILEISQEKVTDILIEARNIKMPRHHDPKASDIDLKRLGSVLALAQSKDIKDFESLLLVEGLGPRTLQSLALVSEVIHGTPTRFTDPARFSFAHGGKDGFPFPVPLKVYDKTISVLSKAVDSAKLEHSERLRAFKKLSEMSRKLEKSFVPNQNFEQVVAKERRDSHLYGGMTVNGPAQAPSQLSLFAS